MAARLDRRRRESNRVDDVPGLIEQRIKAESENLRLILDSLQKRKQPIHKVDSEEEIAVVQTKFEDAVRRSIQALR